MYLTLPRRPQEHLRLWRRFHESLMRDGRRLSQVLAYRPDISTDELTTWWDRFAPAMVQCDDVAARLFAIVPSIGSEAAPPTRSTKLREAVGAIGLAIGVLSPEDAEGESSASDRSGLARRALELVKGHEAETAEYLTRSVAADEYRTWERGAIGALTYNNVSFLAPWLLDQLSTADRSALFRDVPHLRVMRCDDVWMRRYQQIASVIRQLEHRTGD